MQIRNRIKINENIDEKLLDNLDLISKTIDFPKSRMLEAGMKYVLKNQLTPVQKNTQRKPVNLTINRDLWNDFKTYSKSNNFKLVHLLEVAFRYSIKKYKKEITK